MYIAKYLAQAGVCSRRRAIQLVKTGSVSINGEVVTDATYIVKPEDKVEFNGVYLKPESFKYILLNKPRDCITTLSDERNRRTIMELINTKKLGRLYPVGRLDRMTTGLIVMTNDGNLAQSLSHPKNNISKGYHVVLDKNFEGQDFAKLLQGVRLTDGFIKPDSLSYQSKFCKRKLIIKIHSGKNRIIRRIFEKLGYKVIKLDRFLYAGLTKRSLPVGTWRFLKPEEIELLKNFKNG